MSEQSQLATEQADEATPPPSPAPAKSKRTAPGDVPIWYRILKEFGLPTALVMLLFARETRWIERESQRASSETERNQRTVDRLTGVIESNTKALDALTSVLQTQVKEMDEAGERILQLERALVSAHPTIYLPPRKVKEKETVP